jgi:hypothetical protein
VNDSTAALFTFVDVVVLATLATAAAFDSSDTETGDRPLLITLSSAAPRLSAGSEPVNCLPCLSSAMYAKVGIVY